MSAPGAEIARIIKSRDIEQVQLARACGLTKQAMNNIVLDKRVLSAPMALLISEALSTSAEALLGLQQTADIKRTRAAMKSRLAKVRKLPLVKEAA